MPSRSEAQAGGDRDGGVVVLGARQELLVRDARAAGSGGRSTATSTSPGCRAVSKIVDEELVQWHAAFARGTRDDRLPSSAISIGGGSWAGSAWARLPPTVAWLRMRTVATRANVSASAGTVRLDVGRALRLAMGGQRADLEAAVGEPADAVAAR